MIFYAADMFFGEDIIAQRRGFKDAYSMDFLTIRNWNSVITQDDSVYILGGVGSFKSLPSLNGFKHVFLTHHERLSYLRYIYSVTTIKDDPFNHEMFETYLKVRYNVKSVFSQTSITIWDCTGDPVQLIIGNNIDPKHFSIFGNLGDNLREYKNGINANIFTNNMTPISEVEARKFKRKNFT